MLSIFNTHIGRGDKVLKKLTVVYIQKDTAQTLNLFNSLLIGKKNKKIFVYTLGVHWKKGNEM